jgi:hypothetical protein
MAIGAMREALPTLSAFLYPSFSTETSPMVFQCACMQRYTFGAKAETKITFINGYMRREYSD